MITMNLFTLVELVLLSLQMGGIIGATSVDRMWQHQRMWQHRGPNIPIRGAVIGSILVLANMGAVWLQTYMFGLVNLALLLCGDALLLTLYIAFVTSTVLDTYGVKIAVAVSLLPCIAFVLVVISLFY